MTAHAATAIEACAVCGGPCREPFRLPPIHDDYPFLPPEVIAMTQVPTEPVADQPPRPQGKRSRRPGENTMKPRGEDNTKPHDEDR